MMNLPDFRSLAPSKASAVIALKLGWLRGSGGTKDDIHNAQIHDRYLLIANS